MRRKILLRRVKRSNWLASSLMAISAGICSPAMALDASDLQWDLSYAKAMKFYSVGEDELLRKWLADHPLRPIHQRLASYAGAPIEASALVERPSVHNGDPATVWVVKTQAGAEACFFNPKSVAAPCRALTTARADAFFRKVLALRPQGEVAEKPAVEGAGGQRWRFNYLGFLSVNFEGRVLQRPVSVSEGWDVVASAATTQDPSWGQLDLALSSLMKSDAEAAAFEKEVQSRLDWHGLVGAIRRGDTASMAEALDRGVPLQRPDETPLVAVAVEAGQLAALELLLSRGADIDARESAALKAAVTQGSAEWVNRLLSMGAAVDPRNSADGDRRTVYESALGTAVRSGQQEIAALLIARGADARILQSRPMLAVAAMRRDVAMVDLLLKAGAPVDAKEAASQRTALMFLMSVASRPADKTQLDWNAIDPNVEELLRRLVAAGADLNQLTPICGTAYSELPENGQVPMKQLLVSLGADAELHRRCKAWRRAGEGAADAEAVARRAVSDATRQALRTADVATLEALHARYLQEDRRTPSGIWKLALFYYELSNFADEGARCECGWDDVEKQAIAWQKSHPRSLPARLLQVDVHKSRARHALGQLSPDQLPPEKRQAMLQAGGRALELLKAARPLANQDPDWDRTYLEMMPYAGRSASEIARQAKEAARRHPDYHELYFAAAVGLQPAWGGSNEAVDRMVREAASARSGDEARALYARIYWVIDQWLHPGALFERSAVRWSDMKPSFEALLRQYPEPANLNTYGYFACKAGDMPTLSAVLDRLGSEGVRSKRWGDKGWSTYIDCRNQASRARQGAKPAASRS